jgi:hypothetical protein
VVRGLADISLLAEAPAEITPYYAQGKHYFGRMDEVKAARELVLCCWLPDNYISEQKATFYTYSDLRD